LLKVTSFLPVELALPVGISKEKQNKPAARIAAKASLLAIMGPYSLLMSA
jgi:hypothetical protein